MLTLISFVVAIISVAESSANIVQAKIDQLLQRSEYSTVYNATCTCFKSSQFVCPLPQESVECVVKLLNSRLDASAPRVDASRLLEEEIQSMKDLKDISAVAKLYGVPSFDGKQFGRGHIGNYLTKAIIME